nr:MAG TPA: hypothetical protein [Caudoviricetes sp.]
MSNRNFRLKDNMFIFCHNIINTIFSVFKLLSQALK